MANGRLLVSVFLLLAVEGGIVVAEQAPELLGPPDGSTVVLSRTWFEPQELLLLVGRALGWETSSRPAHRPPVVFSWRSAPGQPTYRLVVAGTQDLERPIVDRTTAGTSEAVHCLGPGVYYWKVTAGDAASSVASFSLR